MKYLYEYLHAQERVMAAPRSGGVWAWEEDATFIGDPAEDYDLVVIQNQDIDTAGVDLQVPSSFGSRGTRAVSLPQPCMH